MNQLYELREWLTDRIDGSEEMRGEDGLISDFIRQIDALPSEMGAIPDAETPITDAVVKMMEAGWLSLGSSAPGAVRPLVEALEVFERENADLKHRLLPQYIGRAERAEKARQMAEHERDGMHEKLIAARSATAETAIGHARYEYIRTLNPRKFAALYDEALHGDRFDDLVDRRRMKKEQPE